MKYFIQYLLFLSLCFVQIELRAAECSAIFPDGLQNSNNGGKITFGWQSQLLNNQSGGVLLSNKSIGGVPGAGNTCNPLECTNSGTIADQATFADFPGDDGNVTVGFQGVGDFTEGDYNNLTLNSEATLNLQPGDYTFKGNVNISNKAVINVASGSSGTVRIYFKKAVSLSSEVTINATGGDQYIFIYSKQAISLLSDVSANAALYSSSTVTLSDGASVVGAITAEGNITLGSTSYVTYDSSIIDGTDFGDICTGPELVLEYRMEELNWPSDGVADNSGNGLDGTVSGDAVTKVDTPAIAGDPGTCRYGDFDGGGDVLRTSDNALLDLTSAASITAWVYPRSAGSSNSGLIVGKGEAFNYSYRLSMQTGNNFAFTWCHTTGVLGVCTASNTVTSSSALTLNQWSHVAVAFKEGEQKLYINGVESGSGSFSEAIADNNLELFVGGFEWSVFGFFNEFDGFIDETRVYNGKLSQSQVAAIMAETHPCPATSIDYHYAISHNGTAVTCEPATVTVTGHLDSDHSAYVIDAGTVTTLTTTPANDGWSLISGNGSLNGNQYTWDGVDSSAQFGLAKVDNATLNIDLEDDQGQTDLRDSSNSEDLDISFVQAVFSFIADGVVDAIGVQRAGRSTAQLGSQSLALRITATDPNTGECSSTTDGDVTVDFAYECQSPATCILASGVDINGNPIAGYADSSVGAGTSVTLAFSGGEAPFTFNYLDAGRIRLHAEADIEFDVDDPATPATETVTDNVAGISNPFVVRPEGLCIESNDTDSDCASGNENCSKFVAAGANFSETISARAWSIDSDSDFCDNAIVTRNFAYSGVGLTHSLIKPDSAGSSAGSLGVTSASIVAAAVTGGETTVSNQTISEVGVFTLSTPQLDNYLGDSDADIPAATSAYVGRFYPNHFSLAGVLVTPDACSFAYLEQPLNAELDVTAKNVDDDVTVNYRDGFVFLTDTLGTVALGAVDATDSESYNTRLTLGPRIATWLDGVGDLAVEYTLPRLTGGPITGEPEAPFFAVQHGVLPTDTDGVTVRAADLDLDTSLDSNNDSVAINTMDYYYGRLFTQGVFGPETADLAAPFRIEYFNGAAFIPHVLDSCSLFDMTQIDYDANPIDATVAARTVDLAGGSSVGSYSVIDAVNDELSFIQGDAEQFFSAPGTAITDRDIQLDVDLVNYPWLRFDWDQNDNFNDDTALPTATVQFQTYRGNDRVIYWREVLQ